MKTESKDDLRYRLKIIGIAVAYIMVCIFVCILRGSAIPVFIFIVPVVFFGGLFYLIIKGTQLGVFNRNVERELSGIVELFENSGFETYKSSFSLSDCHYKMELRKDKKRAIIFLKMGNDFSKVIIYDSEDTIVFSSFRKRGEQKTLEELLKEDNQLKECISIINEKTQQ